ncbi:hypothetical protein N0V83_006811 [Neocucurbitaria cava]|uniref:RING-type domain-containing protein n=1 Tax=Neocucurbitaria cava TaxID=798079 RepID=A0A9W8Y8A7_9PLEO|nr:hypothetical protein N0V83_006811 [Neocucurbitaria cava]
MTTTTPSMQIELTNPTCVLWAVVALARLEEKLPSNSVAFQLFSEQEAPQLFRFRDAVEETIRTFSDESMTNVWCNLYQQRMDEIMNKLKRTATDYIQHPSSGLDPDNEICYLVSIFEAFHRKIRDEVPLGADDAFSGAGATNAVALQLSTLVGRTLHDIIGNLSVMLFEEAPDHLVNLYLEEHTTLMCQAIENYIRAQADLKVHANYDANGNIGEMFVRLIRAPLREQIDNCFEALSSRLDFAFGIVNAEDDDAKAEIANFIREVAQFFSYASPLLSDFWIQDGDSDNDSDGTDYHADHQFDRYTEEDWHWQEAILDELEDVLSGPENVTLDQVSSVAMTTDESSCDICGDTESTMRQLNACSHQICQQCLTTQLSTSHASRYKCAFCRAEFFPDQEDEEDQEE